MLVKLRLISIQNGRIKPIKMLCKPFLKPTFSKILRLNALKFHISLNQSSLLVLKLNQLDTSIYSRVTRGKTPTPKQECAFCLHFNPNLARLIVKVMVIKLARKLCKHLEYDTFLKKIQMKNKTIKNWPSCPMPGARRPLARGKKAINF